MSPPGRACSAGPGAFIQGHACRHLGSQIRLPSQGMSWSDTIRGELSARGLPIVLGHIGAAGGGGTDGWEGWVGSQLLMVKAGLFHK